jgi:integrase-like protein
MNGRLVHHSDRGVQYTSVRYTERLGEISAVRSVGRKGDSYDNAAAEALNSLYKKELIDREGPWRGVEDVMLATLEWVDWYNTERLHSACKHMPPQEYEDNYYARQESVVPVRDGTGKAGRDIPAGVDRLPSRSPLTARPPTGPSTTQARWAMRWLPRSIPPLARPASRSG